MSPPTSQAQELPKFLATLKRALGRHGHQGPTNLVQACGVGKWRVRVCSGARWWPADASRECFFHSSMHRVEPLAKWTNILTLWNGEQG